MPLTPNDITFAADIMVGRLARWLRTLGYDTIYKTNLEAKYLVKLAEEETRTLLTRSPRLIEENPNVNSFLVRQHKPKEQMKTIMTKFQLGTDWIFSRCILCNVKVESISREKIIDQIAEGVLQTSQQFYRCPNCKKIFWEGSHRKRFEEFLNNLILPEEI